MARDVLGCSGDTDTMPNAFTAAGSPGAELKSCTRHHTNTQGKSTLQTNQSEPEKGEARSKQISYVQGIGEAGSSSYLPSYFWQASQGKEKLENKHPQKGIRIR